MNCIQLPLRRDASYAGHEIKAPKLLVRLGLNDRWSRPTWALVDTGSPFTLVSRKLALELGWQPESAQPSVDLQGLGRRGTGWQAVLDVSLLASAVQEPQLGLLLPKCIVIVTTLIDERNVLIGQHDVLERLRLVQRNQAPHWNFELALPEAPEGRR